MSYQLLLAFEIFKTTIIIQLLSNILVLPESVCVQIIRLRYHFLFFAERKKWKNKGSGWWKKTKIYVIGTFISTLMTLWHALLPQDWVSKSIYYIVNCMLAHQVKLNGIAKSIEGTLNYMSPIISIISTKSMFKLHNFKWCKSIKLAKKTHIIYDKKSSTRADLWEEHYK